MYTIIVQWRLLNIKRHFRSQATTDTWIPANAWMPRAISFCCMEIWQDEEHLCDDAWRQMWQLRLYVCMRGRLICLSIRLPCNFVCGKRHWGVVEEDCCIFNNYHQECWHYVVIIGDEYWQISTFPQIAPDKLCKTYCAMASMFVAQK